MTREEREFTSDGDRWRATVARRGASGHALVYFVQLEDDGPVGDDRRDRRTGLEPGRELSDLDVDALRAGLEEGTAPTATERRFRAPDGRLWLAQNVGPVWAEDDVAEAATGIVFTGLEGAYERLVADGGHVGRMSRSDLVARWRSAGPGDERDRARGAEDAGSPALEDQ